MTCTEHKLDRGFISIFCYTDSHYVQKANEPIEQRGRCAYKDIPLRQYSCHKTGHMTFSSHREIRRVAAKLCPSFWAKKVENSCIITAKGNNIDVIYIRRNITTTILALYGPCQLWLHQQFWENAFVSGAFNAFTCNRGRWPDDVKHGIVGCLATSVAKVPERWKHSIKQHRCYNKYVTVTIFELGSIFLFQIMRLVALLIGRPMYVNANCSVYCLNY